MQVLGEAGDRLIGNGKKFVEDDAELASQNLFVIGFQISLRSGQFRAERVIDQMKRQCRAVADAVEFSERGNAFLKHAVAALLIDVFRRVAGQGGDDLGLMPGQVFRQPAVSFRFDYGQVVSVNNFGAGRARAIDQVTKELA